MIIRTRYLRPTDYRGSRISASTYGKCKIIQWDHSLRSHENYVKAARSLGYTGLFQREPWNKGWLFIKIDPQQQVEL